MYEKEMAKLAEEYRYKRNISLLNVYRSFSTIFGVFAKLRKAIISFVMFVRPSAWNNSATHWKGFYDIWYLSVFRKNVQKFQGSLKSDKNNRYFT